MSDQFITSEARRCACATIRRTDRVLTQFYDEILAPSGLSAPQFGLLAILAQVAPITIHRLAEHMDIDRTTLTRNLKLLIKQNLVGSEEGGDRRMRRVLLTQEGEQARRQYKASETVPVEQVIHLAEWKMEQWMTERESH